MKTQILEDHDGMFLTQLDVEIIRRMGLKKPRLYFYDAQPDEWKNKSLSTERDECLLKLKKLGIIGDIL